MEYNLNGDFMRVLSQSPDKSQLQVPRHAKGLICFRVEERSRPSRIIRGAGIGLCDVMYHLRWVLHWMLDLVLQGQIYTCCHFLSMMLEW
jgi:hypothetical protein